MVIPVRMDLRAVRILNEDYWEIKLNLFLICIRLISYIVILRAGFSEIFDTHWRCKLMTQIQKLQYKELKLLSTKLRTARAFS